MKMIHKMILLFSILAILTTAGNSVYFYQTSMEDLDQRTYDNLSRMGSSMLNDIEQLVELMDYAIESLTANTEFMTAFHTASQQGDSDDIGEMMAVQNLMSRTLYQEPILERFYRVNVYSENGFFLSNHFEKTGTIISMSDEAKETFASLPYLAKADATPFKRVLNSPHHDFWAVGQAEGVFSAVKSVAWHGHHIGYIEVYAHLDELADIFFLRDMPGFMAQAILDDGRQLFRTYGDDVVYSELSETDMTRVTLADGTDRLVVPFRSDHLGLNIFVSQDMSVYNRQARELLRNNIAVASVMLVITIGFVVAFSLGLTRAIRKLTRRVKHLPVDSILAHSDEVLTTTVTSPRDPEIHKLENTLNRLMGKLQTSIHNELALREGTLQAQLNALQMQINPHFIYNTLNIISAKGMECGSEEITDICDQFAQMLRYATDLRSKTATLGEELQNARRYLQLVKARYEDQLSYTIDVPESMNDLTLPKLALQPIVENALTHGFAGRTDPRVVSITGTVESSMLHLVVRDNGNGFSDESLLRLHGAFQNMEANPSAFSSEGGEHVGLVNTYLRLLHASKGRIRMTLHNDSGAVITLTLPIEQENSHV